MFEITADEIVDQPVSLPTFTLPYIYVCMMIASTPFSNRLKCDVCCCSIYCIALYKLRMISLPPIHSTTWWHSIKHTTKNIYFQWEGVGQQHDDGKWNEISSHICLSVCVFLYTSMFICWHGLWFNIVRGSQNVANLLILIMLDAFNLIWINRRGFGGSPIIVLRLIWSFNYIYAWWAV